MKKGRSRLSRRQKERKPPENMSSVLSVLVDMSEQDFAELLEMSNLTSLLNIKTSLHIAYSDAVKVKDDIILGVTNNTIDQEKGKEIVHELHKQLLVIENRFKQVCSLLDSRLNQVEENVKRLKDGV